MPHAAVSGSGYPGEIYRSPDPGGSAKCFHSGIAGCGTARISSIAPQILPLRARDPQKARVEHAHGRVGQDDSLKPCRCSPYRDSMSLAVSVLPRRCSGRNTKAEPSFREVRRRTRRVRCPGTARRCRRERGKRVHHPAAGLAETHFQSAPELCHRDSADG